MKDKDFTFKDYIVDEKSVKPVRSNQHSIMLWGSQRGAAMKAKYGLEVKSETVRASLIKLINQVYKLLPTREERGDWEKPLSSIQEEICGISNLFEDKQKYFFPIISKLEGLFFMREDSHFDLYRKTIFEILNLMNKVVDVCQD